MSAQCRVCGAPIEFVASPQGKRIPVNVEAYKTVVTDKGEVVRHGPAGDLRDDPSIADIYLGFEGAAGGAEGREA